MCFLTKISATAKLPEVNWGTAVFFLSIRSTSYLHIIVLSKVSIFSSFLSSRDHIFSTTWSSTRLHGSSGDKRKQEKWPLSIWYARPSAHFLTSSQMKNLQTLKNQSFFLYFTARSLCLFASFFTLCFLNRVNLIWQRELGKRCHSNQ